MRVLAAVEEDRDNQRTRVSWDDPLGHGVPQIEPASEAVQVFALRTRAALFGHNAPDPRLMNPTGTSLGALIDGQRCHAVVEELHRSTTDDRPRPRLPGGYGRKLAGAGVQRGRARYTHAARLHRAVSRRRGRRGQPHRLRPERQDHPRHAGPHRYPPRVTACGRRWYSPRARSCVLPLARCWHPSTATGLP